MRKALIPWCAAGFMAWQAAGLAQVGPQTPTQSPVQTAPRSGGQTDQLGERTRTKVQMTVTGCIQSEADYLRTSGSKKSGGQAVGGGNEFVLVNATTVKTSAPSAANQSGRTSDEKAAGKSETTVTYRLTGDRENELEAALGKRVEIVATLKDDKLDVTSFKMLSGVCS